MNKYNPPIATLADIMRLVEASDLAGSRRRDTVSAIKRLAHMMGASPQSVTLAVPSLQAALADIRPAAHGITVKTLSNLKSRFASALGEAGVIDRMPHGIAQHDKAWKVLVASIAGSKHFSHGLAAFFNWCALNAILPNDVSDETVQKFAHWLQTRTLYAKPRDMIRRVPKIWNEAQATIAGWPDIKLATISFRGPSKHLSWDELDDNFCIDAKRYLSMRKDPDIFDEHPDAPRQPLAVRTLKLQREHLRSTASILIKSGRLEGDIVSLDQLVEREAFKIILRHYHNRAKGTPCSYAISIAKTLIQVARYHVRVSPEQLADLKSLAAKLPQIPFDLTAKNKALLRQFESEDLRAKLVWLPETLMAHVKTGPDVNIGKLTLVDAQVAIAVAILLVAPLRPQNLSRLNWRRHFSAPNGRRGKLMLHIPAAETKTGKRELIFELPKDVCQAIYWYRDKVLLALNADPDGDLFVTYKAIPKHQATLTEQIGERIELHLGLRISPHQFRHLAAMFYLDKHPEDFETVRALLGHSFAKTTLIYAGSSVQRASRVYGKFVTDQREALKLMYSNQRTRRKAKHPATKKKQPFDEDGS